MDTDAKRLREIILDLPKQLVTALACQGDALPVVDKFIVCGMGGSALAAGLMKVYRPELDLLIHRDYGLPRVPAYFLHDSLLILSSYSGNTEEVLDTLQTALTRELKVVILASGGALLAEAKRLNLPHLVLPAGLPPRQAVGYFFVALSTIFKADSDLEALRQMALVLQPVAWESTGQRLAGLIGERLPIIYTSTPNYYLGYNWKIRFNEDSKTPAFCNVLPEMNHNELAATPMSGGSSANFFYIFLRDPADDPRIQNRFKWQKEMFEKRGLIVEEVPLAGGSSLTKIFNAVILADWTAYYLALAKGQDPVEVPTIEEFKKQIKTTL